MWRQFLSVVLLLKGCQSLSTPAGGVGGAGASGAPEGADSQDGAPAAVMAEIGNEIFAGKPPSLTITFLFYLVATSLALLFKDVGHEKDMTFERAYESAGLGRVFLQDGSIDEQVDLSAGAAEKILKKACQEETNIFRAFNTIQETKSEGGAYQFIEDLLSEAGSKKKEYSTALWSVIGALKQQAHPESNVETEEDRNKWEPTERKITLFSYSLLAEMCLDPSIVTTNESRSDLLRKILRNGADPLQLLKLVKLTPQSSTERGHDLMEGGNQLESDSGDSSLKEFLKMMGKSNKLAPQAAAVKLEFDESAADAESHGDEGEGEIDVGEI